MAVQNTQQNLTTLVNRWEQRFRWQQAVTWLPRSLVPALVLGIALAVLARLTPALPDSTTLLMTAAGLVLGVVVMLAVIMLRPRSSLDSARRFDVRFGLGERVSTALELIEGRIRSDEGIMQHQVSDALDHAQRVQPADYLPFDVRWREWGVVAALALILLALVAFTAPVQALDPAAEEQQATIEEAVEDVKDAIEEISADNTLDEQTRDELLEALETRLETLQDENLTTEEAFATLNEIENALQDAADELNEQAAQQQEALSTAMQPLENMLPPEQQEQAPEETAQSLSQMLADMSAEEMQNAAEALEQAADSLQETNPEAAEALRDAAEALRNNDPQAAQEALNQAAQEMQNQQSQNSQQQQSAQEMQQSAQDMQNAQQQLSQSQQQQSQSGQQPQQGQQGQDQSGQQGSDDQSGPQTGGQEGDNPTTQQNQNGGQNSQGQNGQNQNQGDSSQPSNGSGAGDAAGDLGTDDTAQGNQADPNAPSNNNPDGEGEREYESVFAPNSLDAPDGDDEIRLEADPGDQPLTQGEFSENPDGSVTVPYNQVFSDYSNAATRALEADYIPLGLRDVIRDYFTSLDPNP